MNKPKLYAEREVSEYPDFYIAHVEAMTTEKLHSKGCIAAELAYRDKRIAELEVIIKKHNSIESKLDFLIKRIG